MNDEKITTNNENEDTVEVYETDEKYEVELDWCDLFRLSSGKNIEGDPRSAAVISIDKIYPDKVEKIKEVFLENAVLSFCVSGGCATVVADFPESEYGYFMATKNLYESWFTKEVKDMDMELSFMAFPFSLAGQIILLFTGLAFADSYQFSVDNKRMYRIVFCFDNNSTVALRSDDIDYMELYNSVSIELKRMEDEIDNEIQEAQEEERKATEELNAIDLEFKKKLNDPLGMLNANKQTEDEKMIHDQESGKIRFVDEKENMR